MRAKGYQHASEQQQAVADLRRVGDLTQEQPLDS